MWGRPPSSMRSSARGAVAANYPFSTVETNTGIAQVPDPRVDRLVEIFKSKKKTPARWKSATLRAWSKEPARVKGWAISFLDTSGKSTRSCMWCAVFKAGMSCMSAAASTRFVTSAPSKPNCMLADLEALDRRKQKTEKKVRAGDKKAAFELSFMQIDGFLTRANGWAICRTLQKSG